APAEIQAIATSLCDASGLEFDATQVLLAWLTRFAENLRMLAAGGDLASRWQPRCALRDKMIELRAGDRLVRGVCRGIDETGALRVETPAGVEKLYGGVVVRVVG